MPIQKVKDFLDNNKIKYVIMSHSPAYTAMEVAANAHVSGHELAKTVMVKLDNRMTMIILPASYKIDFQLLKEVTGAKKVELAHEEEFTGIFPKCETGAMPPFGNLYHMEVFVAESLTQDKEIAFTAGSHSEVIKMSYKDFEMLVKPIIMRISVMV